MSQSIIEFLNLKEDEIQDIKTTSESDCLAVYLTLSVKPHKCPHCGVLTYRIKDYHCRIINHGLFLDRKCIVHYNQRRYLCQICNKSFNESCLLVNKHQKKSLASHLLIMELAKNPHMTFKNIGELLHLSTNAVMNDFYRNLPIHIPVFPRVLCIDEVYLGRNAIKKYVAHLLDFENNRTVDIIYGRTKDSLHSYFQKIPNEQLNKVLLLSSDMYEGYRFLKNHYFPNAKLCVDSFHVIKLINDMFNSVLKSILRQYVSGSVEYYLLKKKRYLLLRNESKTDWFKNEFNYKFKQHISNLRLRELLFNINPLIKEIYYLKEEYISFNKIKDTTVIPDKLNTIIHKFLTHSHKDVKRVGRTLRKWDSEIINSFSFFNGARVSNGPIESRNNTIKLLIHNAAGYRNFNHLKSRVIYCINSSKKER